MSEPKVIKQIKLAEKYDYNYCPYCRQELIHEGKDFRTILSPMKKFTTVEILTREDGSEFEYFDNFYVCDRECCKDRKMTEDEIVRKVTCRWDGTRWDEKSKPFMRWDNKKKQWEETTSDRY